MINSKKRQRKVNLDSLSEADLTRVTNDLSEKLRAIVDEACAKANTLVDPYGAKVLMRFQIEPKTPSNK